MIKIARLRARRQDSGFVMVFASIALGTLLLFSGFSVDLGNWYLSASRIQKAADSAALAGVAVLPDATRANTVALENAKQNGYDDASPNITITVTPVNLTTLQVEIKKNDVKTYFTSMVMRQITIDRKATATKSDGIVLGNPTNAYGLGDLSTTAAAKGAWAAMNGWCNAGEQGDYITTPREGNLAKRSTGLTNCNDPTDLVHDLNTKYDANGYFYSITLPASRPSPYELDVYDAPWTRGIRTATDDVVPSPGSADGPGQVWPDDDYGVPTRFTVRSPDATPDDPTNNPIFSPSCNKLMNPQNGGDTAQFDRVITVANDPSGTRKNRWTNLCTFPQSAPGGTYILQINNEPGFSATNRNTFGTNDFGMIVQPAGSTSLNICTASATCPQIQPLKYMTMNVPLDNATAEVYLAEVPPSDAGKTLKIGSFDPGDGAIGMQLLDPAGNPVDFTWNVPGDPDPILAGSPMSIAGKELDTTQDGTGRQVWTDRYTTNLFNDRNLTLYAPIPTDYATTYAANGGWWKIRYICIPDNSSGSYKSDSTTWTVGLTGSPIHLTD